MPKPPENRREFESLVEIVGALRGPDGCPWDLEQTHQTLGRFAIEEAHELVESIEGGSVTDLAQELGDLLLQVVLHAEIARQRGAFDVHDVIQAIGDKMVRRHPHVFADAEVNDAADVVRNWTAIKDQEKKTTAPRAHAFDIPAALPALARAHKIGEKTRARNFDWDTADQCWEKVREEFGELTRAREDGEGLAREEAELGDLLFSLAQWARHRGLDAERALRAGNRAFEDRYRRMRETVDAAGDDFDALSPRDKEALWKASKPVP